MKIKTSRKKYPKGWDIISPTLEEFNIKMREAENDPHEGKRKTESHWQIFRIHHQRSRYIYELFYKNKGISRELYEFCLNEGIADKNLIAKWKKPGFGYLCCLRCIQDLSHVCICRVPPKGLIKKSIIECVSCGCKGCSGASTKTEEEEEEEEEEEQQQQKEYNKNNLYRKNNSNNDEDDENKEDQVGNKNNNNKNKSNKKDEKEEEEDEDN